MVEKIEDEFKTSRMKNRKLFYDINLRAPQPQFLRSKVTSSFHTKDYNIILNSQTNFEIADFEGFFNTSKMKPVKAYIKCIKEKVVGSRFPLLWKVLLLIGTLFILFYALNFFRIIDARLSFVFLIAGINFYFASILVYYVKKKVKMSVWTKIIGIYDIEGEKCDLRLILSADTTSKDHDLFSELENEISELYLHISSSFVKIDELKKSEMIPAKLPETKVISKLHEINDNISKLEKRLVNAEISEQTYNELKSSLVEKKERYETLIDLLALK